LYVCGCLIPLHLVLILGRMISPALKKATKQF
jgi:hypothetical protein